MQIPWVDQDRKKITDLETTAAVVCGSGSEPLEINKAHQYTSSLHAPLHLLPCVLSLHVVFLFFLLSVLWCLAVVMSY